MFRKLMFPLLYVVWTWKFGLFAIADDEGALPTTLTPYSEFHLRKLKTLFYDETEMYVRAKNTFGQEMCEQLPDKKKLKKLMRNVNKSLATLSRLQRQIKKCEKWLAKTQKEEARRKVNTTGTIFGVKSNCSV